MDRKFNWNVRHKTTKNLNDLKLFQACKSFCEELIRRGHSESFRDGNLHNANVDLVHLVRGIVNNKRMSFLTNQGLADQEDLVESSSAKNLWK